jgi:Fe-S-cluster-containing dehydrogenase component
MKEYAILLDNTNCTGCNTCGYRCVQEYRYHDQASKGLFRTFVKINDEGLYQKRCMHCQKPTCVENCPTKALTKSGYGPVLYNAQTCIGCGMCTKVCPFEVPQLDEATKKIVKCSFCANRIGAGKQPACTEVCPTGALQFGEYNVIKTQAAKQAKEKKLKIYGYTENGGTHLFVLSKKDLVAAGYPKVAQKARKNDGVNLGSAVALPAMAALAVTGFKKFSDRRAKLETEEKTKKSK